MEDLPWKVTCVNRITGESRDVHYGEFNADRGYCNQPEEYKVIFEHVCWTSKRRNTADETPTVRSSNRPRMCDTEVNKLWPKIKTNKKSRMRINESFIFPCFAVVHSK